MVEQGVNYILYHPAPRHKPWTIMQKRDQAGFKQSLLAFDKLLDQQAQRVLETMNSNNWQEANNVFILYCLS